jgi:L-fuculose-phosphate aldolase
MAVATQSVPNIEPPDEALTAELQLLAKASRILEIHGHGDRIFGHVAMRDPQGRGFWLKRHGISLGEVFDDRDFVLLSFDGKQLYGEGKRHNEWPIHAEVLKARPDLNFTAHTHPFYSVIYSSIAEPLPLLHARRFPAPNRFEDTSDFILQPEQGASLAKALGDGLVLLMRHHGIVYCGRTRLELITTGVGLEEACQEALLANASGLTWSEVPVAERAQRVTSQKTRMSGRDTDLWDYYCRILARAEQAGDMRLSRAPVR